MEAVVSKTTEEASSRIDSERSLLAHRRGTFAQGNQNNHDQDEGTK